MISFARGFPSSARNVGDEGFHVDVVGAGLAIGGSGVAGVVVEPGVHRTRGAEDSFV